MFENVMRVSHDLRLHHKRGPHIQVGYCLYQLLRLLDQPVVAEEFAPLKTLDVALANDQLWAQICVHLGWRFHPTV